MGQSPYFIIIDSFHSLRGNQGVDIAYRQENSGKPGRWYCWSRYQEALTFVGFFVCGIFGILEKWIL